MKKGICNLAAALAILAAFLPGKLTAEVKIWTSDVVSDELSLKAVKEIKPVTLVGARNGSFSGKIVVESSGSIKSVKASAGALTGKDGTIPAKNVQIRYGKFWDRHGGREPAGADILTETFEEAAPVKGRAVVPVWVSVIVPKDASAGTYTGEVNVQADGASARVKLSLEVSDWTMPDSQDYRTFTDFVQSPDSLAVEYNVPLWSEKHWKLIDRSFQLLSGTGSRVVYIPLICRTNFGNEQTMVRWVKKGTNSYEYDYTILDKYLDSAEKNLGKPKQVIFLVWDISMSTKSLSAGINIYVADKGKAVTESRQQLLGKGARVTAFDPVTNNASTLTLPRYEDPASKSLWQPMFTEVLKRMKKRNLENNLMLGIMPDIWPSKEEVTFWKDIAGGLSWAIHGHAGAANDVMIGNKGLYKIADIGYAAFVYNLVYNVNPDKGRLYGWKIPALLSAYDRFVMNQTSCCGIREAPAFNITGGQRGLGRLSAEFWYAVKDKSGARGGSVFMRYPENNWRNLDIGDWFLAPGPDGALSTARLESLKEGVQVCEARIFLEDALLDANKKAKLGSDLAKRSQDALDEQHRAMWKSVWSSDEDLKMVGKTEGNCRNPPEALWFGLVKAGKKMPEYWAGSSNTLRSDEARKGGEIFAVGWQEREKKLFDLAGEADAKLTGGASSKTSDSSGPVAEAVSKNTGIPKEKVLELLRNKGTNKDEIISVCAAAEITKGDPDELYKKRKKVNTNFDFLSDLKLDKEGKAKLEALIKTIKGSIEEKKLKK